MCINFLAFPGLKYLLPTEEEEEKAFYRNQANFATY